MHECQHRFDGVIGDPRVGRAIGIIAREIMSFKRVGYPAAQRFVLSAIGDPKTLDELSAVLLFSDNGVARLSLIVRWRVFDLLRKDARRANHLSLPEGDDETGVAAELCSRDDDQRWDPRAQAQHDQLARLVRNAVESFAMLGPTQRAQLELLQRYICDDVSYSQLSYELGATENALRVRVHKAKRALRRYLLRCHPELA